MYNRYIPQSDGSFRRSRIPDPYNPPVHTQSRREEEAPPPQPKQDPPEAPRPRAQYRPMPPRPSKKQEPLGIGSFLKQLLPQNFDTEDLLIVLLLLLMSGDCQEDQNTALLTLVLYLFM